MNGSRQKRSQGLALVLSVLLLTGLCGIAALAVDMGLLYGAKNSAQNAADAAALAGAYTFLNPAASQPGAAQQAAIAVAGTNQVWGQAVKLTTANVSVDASTQEVTVQVPRTGAQGVPAIFGGVLGLLHYDVVASATAQAAPFAAGSVCLRPIFVPNTILSLETPSQACSDGQVLLDASGHLTAWAATQIGRLENIRPTSPTGSLAPGQFYSLDFTGNGANGYRCTLGSTQLSDCGVNPPLEVCGSSYSTEAGNMVGPTKQGIQTLLGPTPDVWLGPGAYLHADGSITNASPQLIAAPVWNDCCAGCQIGPGSNTVPIIGFSSWFVEGISSGQPGVAANFMGSAGCGAGGAGGGGGVSNAPLGIPVRLVSGN